MTLLLKQDKYGYQLTIEVNKVIETKESTIYGILNKLKANGWCNTYIKTTNDGTPNRRYYQINQTGKTQLDKFIIEWRDFSKKIDIFFELENGVHVGESI